MRSFQSLFADPRGGPALIRRIVIENGLPAWRRYLVAFLLMAVTAAATAVPAYLFGSIVNKVYLDHNFPGLIVLCVAIIAIFTIKGLAAYGSAVTLARIGNRVTATNERRMFDKLLSESLGFLAEQHTAEFMARLAAGASAPSQIMTLFITAVGRDFLSLIGLLAVMIVQDPILSIGALIIAPPVVIAMRQLSRRARTVVFRKYASGVATIATLQETLQGIRIVKAFTLEDAMLRRAETSIDDVQSASNKMARVANRSNPVMEALAGVTVALCLLYAGYRVIYTGAKPGALMSFMAAFLLAYEPAKRLARLNIDISASLLGARLFFELIDAPPSEPREDDKPPLALTEARVEFRDVRFTYRPGDPVLNGMSFVAEPGRVTALVGMSGGGKSTVFNLLLRFYEVSGGAVLIDGQDIRTRARESLRRQIGYVGQEIFLFRASVRDNIAFGKPDASEAEIIAAAKAAHAHDFIMASPQRYDTEVGEQGLKLSGGERQRVAIARAVIKDAPIILLDEATAALDAESEQHVQQALAELCKGRTTIVIAHRLATIMHADRILVIEAGNVVEQGRHDELLRKAGRYASFYRLQLRQQETREPITVASGA